jgi:DNA-directed RNA polymerase subunit RPC12/RpoP
MERKCPECGSERVIGIFNEGYFYLTCLDCGHKEKIKDREQAMKAWESNADNP